MEKEKLEPLHEIIRKAEFAAQVELIDVPKNGNPITLLRTKEMPEFAFVMWVSDVQSTKSQLVFNMTPYHGRSERYAVVCACCSSETDGLKFPGSEEVYEKWTPEIKEKYEEWKKEMATKFKEALIRTCSANGITTIFMRHASSWQERYGDVEGLKAIEAERHRDALGNYYKRSVVEESLRFINYGWSRGMGENER